MEITNVGALRFSGPVVFSIILLTDVSARAQSKPDAQSYLSSVKNLYEDLEYERALEQIARAHEVKQTVDEDVTLSLYEGILLAEMGRWEESAAAFLKALRLGPEAQLPAKVSPKVVQHFEKIRLQTKQELATASPVASTSSSLREIDLLQPKHSQNEVTQSSRRWAAWKPWALLGTGAIMTLSGAALHTQACKSYDDFDSEVMRCSGCLPTQKMQGLLDRGDSLKRVAFGTYAVGGAAFITGAVLVYINRPQASSVNTDPTDRAKTPPQVTVAPLLTERQSGILATFLFGGAQ